MFGYEKNIKKMVFLYLFYYRKYKIKLNIIKINLKFINLNYLIVL